MENRFVIARDKDGNWNKKSRLWMVTERDVCVETVQCFDFMEDTGMDTGEKYT